MWVGGGRSMWYGWEVLGYVICINWGCGISPCLWSDLIWLAVRWHQFLWLPYKLLY